MLLLVQHSSLNILQTTSSDRERERRKAEKGSARCLFGAAALRCATTYLLPDRIFLRGRDVTSTPLPLHSACALPLPEKVEIMPDLPRPLPTHYAVTQGSINQLCSPYTYIGATPLLQPSTPHTRIACLLVLLFWFDTNRTYYLNTVPPAPIVSALDVTPSHACRVYVHLHRHLIATHLPCPSHYPACVCVPFQRTDASPPCLHAPPHAFTFCEKKVDRTKVPHCHCCAHCPYTPSCHLPPACHLCPMPYRHSLPLPPLQLTSLPPHHTLHPTPHTYPTHTPSHHTHFPTLCYHLPHTAHRSHHRSCVTPRDNLRLAFIL